MKDQMDVVLGDWLFVKSKVARCLSTENVDCPETRQLAATLLVAREVREVGCQLETLTGQFGKHIDEE